jgi:polyisoprenoid-binding protein YceI
MKNIIYPSAITAIIGLSAFITITSPDWTIVEGYSVKFISDHPTGVFERMRGTIVFDPKDPSTASFNVSVDVASINCGNGMQNRHAKSAKWFDAEKYPAITFVSERVTKSATGYEATGKLSMHGVTQELTIPFTFATNAGGGAFTGTFSVTRSAFNIGEPGGKVPDMMKLEVSVPVKH